MKYLNKTAITFFIYLLFVNINVFAINRDTENNDIDTLVSQIEVLDVKSSSDYDSDSEDGLDYEFLGYYNDLIVPEFLKNKECLLLVRGIHFSKLFSKEQCSSIRKQNYAGRTIFSTAAYELSNIKLCDINFNENQNILDEALSENARIIYNQITSLVVSERNKFQELYTNNYDKFHKQLLSPDLEFKEIFNNFEFTKNPQVSFSQDFLHPLKYAFGLKNLGKNVKKRNPNYDNNGHPKHPYLGKIYIAIIPIDVLDSVDPYFVVQSHFQNKIKVKTHYSCNILSEREVSFPGLFEGKYVVFDQNIRVPSFGWESYPDYYQNKYGISERSFKIQQTKITKKNFKLQGLFNKIFNYQTREFIEKIENICTENGITLVYPNLKDSFSENMLDLNTNKNIK